MPKFEEKEYKLKFEHLTAEEKRSLPKDMLNKLEK